MNSIFSDHGLQKKKKKIEFIMCMCELRIIIVIIRRNKKGHINIYIVFYFAYI
jgi:hypothetical protein